MARVLTDWIETHYNDAAPSDDGVLWGHLIDSWRRSNSSELHIVSIVAATTIWTGDKSVNALVVDELIEMGYRLHARNGKGLTPLLFVAANVNKWLCSKRCGI